MEERLEVLLNNDVSGEDLVQALVGLIRNSPELRRAILEVMWTCPNVRMQI